MQVRKQQLEPDMEQRSGSKLGKKHMKAVYSHSVSVEYIMRNAGLDQSQAGIKIARRNISNLRYAIDTTLMAEIKEELKNILMKVKEESKKAGLKFSI